MEPNLRRTWHFAAPATCRCRGRADSRLCGEKFPTLSLLVRSSSHASLSCATDQWMFSRGYKFQLNLLYSTIIIITIIISFRHYLHYRTKELHYVFPSLSCYCIASCLGKYTNLILTPGQLLNLTPTISCLSLVTLIVHQLSVLCMIFV